MSDAPLQKLNYFQLEVPRVLDQKKKHWMLSASSDAQHWEQGRSSVSLLHKCMADAFCGVWAWPQKTCQSSNLYDFHRMTVHLVAALWLTAHHLYYTVDQV